VYLGLIGLLPSPEEQSAFLADQSPTALAQVVDRLLARPEYGERWARHWLDVARYAETNGYERDTTKPSAWRYRDYVIDSFNEDKPFDRFLIEQLAGDELEDATAETHIATGFLRLGTWDDEPADPLVDRYDQLDDVLGTTASAFLGLTLRCARCHDHKFEPFTQRDYYSMLSVFAPLERPITSKRDELDRAVGSAKELEAYHRQQLRLVATSVPAVTMRLGPEGALASAALIWRLGEAYPCELPRGYVFYENGPQAPITRVFKRGDPTKPVDEVQPAVPVVLFRRVLEAPRPTRTSTGRRLWLARWMASPENPLTARVIVNRIWQHHFGEGLVPSPNDFGEAGEPPSHPELLDWLASGFIAGGWQLKPLHRLICLSRAYQLATAAPRESVKADPDGVLLSHFRQRRLEAETIRDIMLAAGGRLQRQLHGPSVYPPIPRAVLEGQSRPGDGWGKSDERQAARRSVYVFAKRSVAPPELDLLDAPDNTSSCEQRAVSTTGPQALTFLNGDFVRQQARALAERARRHGSPGGVDQIHNAYEYTLCRCPSDREVQQVTAFLSRQQGLIQADAKRTRSAAVDQNDQAFEAFCLVLLNMNEFFLPELMYG
jgi:hypothetical protein